jgi:hypothetical protein
MRSEIMKDLTAEQHAQFAGLDNYDDLVFYALVAKCILTYQGLEDFLESIFVRLAGEPYPRATAIFESVHGLEGKIRVIQAAAVDRSLAVKSELSSLMRRVKAASDVRAKIAHATPVSVGGVLDSPDGPVEGVPRWELYKFGKQVEKFTLGDLLAEYRKADSLFDSLVDFLQEDDEH